MCLNPSQCLSLGLCLGFFFVGRTMAFVSLPPGLYRGYSPLAASRQCRSMCRHPLAMSSGDGQVDTSADGEQQCEEEDFANAEVRLPDIEVPEMPFTEEERNELWEEIRAVKAQLQTAVVSERFADAAMLREKMLEMSARDPYTKLEEELDAAERNEDYIRAAKLKLQMDKLGAPPMGKAQAQAQAGAAGGQEEKVICSTASDTTTNGIRIEVQSQYLPEQSHPERHQYIFIYRVKVTNSSPSTVQLVSRKWEIETEGKQSDGVQVVKGPGVVGQQPVMEPGESFEYSSVCPISSPAPDGGRVLGQMRGKYVLVTGALGEQGFEANIDPFYLVLPKSQ
ncbi:unnamed protein product [Chrysoparadoxa australica]